MNQTTKHLSVLILLVSLFIVTHAQKLETAKPEYEIAAGQTSSFAVNLKEGKADLYNALSLSAKMPEKFSLVGNPLSTSLWKNQFCVTEDSITWETDSIKIRLSAIQNESIMFSAFGDMDLERNVKMAIASANSLPATEVDNLLTCDFETAVNTEVGLYLIKLQNIKFEYAPKGKDDADDVSVRVRIWKLGDTNRDNAVNVVDATNVIASILEPNVSVSYNAMLADMNDDKEIDIFDVMKLKHVILNGKLPNQSQALSRTAEYGIYEDMMLAFSNAGVTIGIPNSQRFTSFQFEIELTDDIELTEAQLIGMTTNHSIEFAKIDDNYYRVLGLSLDNSLLEGNNGNNLIGLEIPNCGKISIRNAMFVTPQGEVTYFNDNEIENGITGIRPVMAPDSESVYDLLGRKITTKGGRLPKGVYIINNKRVVVK